MASPLNWRGDGPRDTDHHEPLALAAVVRPVVLPFGVVGPQQLVLRLVVPQPFELDHRVFDD